MSWKIYLIVISNATNIEINDIPKILGFENLTPQKEISLMEAQYQDDGVSIAKYEDKIVIVSPKLVFDVLENPKSRIKEELIKNFPKSQIVTLTSAYLVYGLNIIDKGVEIRKKMVSDSEKYFDFGEKTPEEIECYEETLHDKELIEGFKEESPKNLEDTVENYSFENALFKISERFFDKPINEQGSKFENIKATFFK